MGSGRLRLGVFVVNSGHPVRAIGQSDGNQVKLFRHYTAGHYQAILPGFAAHLSTCSL